MSFTETLSDDHGSANRAGRTDKGLGQQLVEIIRKRNSRKFFVMNRAELEGTEELVSPKSALLDERLNFFVVERRPTITTGLAQTVRVPGGLMIEAGYFNADVAFRDAEELNVIHNG